MKPKDVIAKNRKTVQVQQSDPPVPKLILADAIVKISDNLAALVNSGLNEKAILILLSHSSGLSFSNCRTVLDSLKDLKRDYCR